MTKSLITRCRNCPPTKKEQQRRIQAVTSQAKWNQGVVTWNTHPSQLKLRRNLSTALDRWESILPIQFKRSDEEPLIVAGLGEVDGDGGTLAYAFFPPLPNDRNPDPLHGDIVYDQVDWAKDGYHSRIEVLTHEVGHALGLDHLDDPQALMYAFFQGPRFGKLRLPDIEAIRAIYPWNDFSQILV